MDHQPFEKWILEPHHLNPDQAHTFEKHLEDCPNCQHLNENWQNAKGFIKQAPMLTPRPGFTARWQASLIERRTRQQIRQVRLVLLGIGGSALVSLLILLGILFRAISPVELLLNGARLLTSINSWLINAQQLFTNLLASPLPLAVWMVLGSSFSLLVTAWVITLWRVSVKGVTVK